MKFLVSADWHLTTKTPRIRKDNYPETQLNKVEWICNKANKLGVGLIIAGDIFDRPSYPSYPLMNKLIALLNKVESGVFVVYGQHDIHYHNPILNKTPLGLLITAGVVSPVERLYYVTAMNFGEECVPDNDNEDWLVAHFPVTSKEPPFFMKDALSAKDFMEKYPQYSVIISGDFHEHHVTVSGKRILVNPGPICRSAKDKMNFEPSVVLVEQNQGKVPKYEVFHLPIEKDVFNLDVIEKDDLNSYKEDIRNLAGNIKTSSIGRKFDENLARVMQESPPREGIRNVISKVMEEVYAA
jgi:DNA repair exonuclease SbcCD nuclease subunit